MARLRCFSAQLPPLPLQSNIVFLPHREKLDNLESSTQDALRTLQDGGAREIQSRKWLVLGAKLRKK